MGADLLADATFFVFDLAGAASCLSLHVAVASRSFTGRACHISQVRFEGRELLTQYEWWPIRGLERQEPVGCEKRC